MEAVGSDGSRYQLETAGEPHALKLTTIENPEGMKADGADMALIQVEVVDKQGRRCPLDNRLINFSLMGEGRWIGGIATGRSDNYVGSMVLPVECGINRVLVRSTVHAGTITVYASADGLKKVEQVVINTQATDVEKQVPALTLKGNMSRGETPLRLLIPSAPQVLPLRRLRPVMTQSTPFAASTIMNCQSGRTMASCLLHGLRISWNVRLWLMISV